jgi:hypothetical protein
MAERLDEELAQLVKLQLAMQKVQVATIRMAEAMTEVTNATADVIAQYAKEKRGA